MFITRYMLQSTIHMIWRERNRRRHGESSVPATILIKKLDKNMRNKFIVIQKKERRNMKEEWLFGLILDS